MGNKFVAVNDLNYEIKLSVNTGIHSELEVQIYSGINVIDKILYGRCTVMYKTTFIDKIDKN